MVEQGTMPASPKTRRPRCPGCRGFTYEVLTFKMRISMIGNCMRALAYCCCNYVFRSACNCGRFRWKLEHGRRDYQRPLRRNPY